MLRTPLRFALVLASLVAPSALHAASLALSFCYPVSPVGPPGAGQILCSVGAGSDTGTSYFTNGQHFLDFNSRAGKYHLGDDWNGDRGGSSDYGDPVYAVADGEVVFVTDLGLGAPHSWGKVVVIEHTLATGERVYSLYGHLSEWRVESLCHNASSILCLVRQGERIGSIGDANGFYSPTGAGCGLAGGCAHLHFELRKIFRRSDPELIPGHAYIADLADPFVAQNYYDPTEFIEQHRGPACVAGSAQTGLKAAGGCSAPPLVSTLTATSVTQGSASLRLAVTPNGANTSAWFDWGAGGALNEETLPHQAVGDGSSTLTVSQALGGLLCGRTYSFRARAQNPAGAAPAGATLSFTTEACGGGGGNPQTRQLIEDPSFERGNRGWWVGTADFYIDSRFRNSRTGRTYAYLSTRSGSPGNNLEGGVLSPVVALPSNTQSAEIRFWASITSDETANSARDVLEVYLIRTGNQLTRLATLSNRDRTGTAYRERRVAIPASFVGQEVQVFFRGRTDASRPTVFRLDDVTLEAVVPASASPIATTRDADEVTDRSARLNLFVNPNGESTDAWFTFEEGDSTPDGETEHVGIGAGGGRKSLSLSVFGLRCATRYYFAAQARSRLGSAQGAVRSFTTATCPPPTGGRPVAATGSPREVTDGAATLTAQVNPNGLSTEAWFEWGEGPGLDQRTTRLTAGSGRAPVAVAQRLTGLACGRTYSFAGRAENGAGSASGVANSFTTAPCAPEGGAPRVTTGEATTSPSAPSQAILNGTVNPNGAETQGFFEWGSTATYGVTTPAISLGAGTSDLARSAALQGLACATVYHFRAVATNRYGTTSGADRAFATGACPPPATHPLVGVWSGTVANHDSTLEIGQNGSAFSARITFANGNEPVETLQIRSITETDILLFRPADVADLRLTRSDSGGQTCLIGEYLEDGSSRPIALCRSTHPMAGIWSGTVAGHSSTLTIAHNGGVFSARLSIAQGNDPVEGLVIRSISEAAVLLYRPADVADMRLTRTQFGGQACLIGEYLENGTSRPIELCRAP